MVKAKDFLSYLCEKRDYRYFAGVVCPGLLPLYDNMSSEFMHYIPVVNERVAIGMAIGASVAGLKSSVLFGDYGVFDIIKFKTIFYNIYRKSFLSIIHTDNIQIGKELKHYGLDFFILDKNFEKKFKEDSIIIVRSGVFE